MFSKAISYSAEKLESKESREAIYESHGIITSSNRKSNQNLLSERFSYVGRRSFGTQRSSGNNSFGPFEQTPTSISSPRFGTASIKQLPMSSTK